MTSTAPAALDDPARRFDWAFACQEPGAVISLSFSGGERPKVARAVVFMDSGETYWFDSSAVGRARSFELDLDPSPGRQRLRFTTKAAILPGTDELIEATGDVPVGRVPLILDVTLAPMARPVVLVEATEAEAFVPTQGFRATGTLAVGSVIHRVDAQAWSSESAFSSRDVESATRLQAVFQDDSSLIATWVGGSTPERTAAMQVHHRIARLSVRALEVDGPVRDVPLTLEAELEGVLPVGVSGAPRHVEGYQHVAFVREGAAPGSLVRVGYTPYDFVRAGITGFGLLEHVAPIEALERPVPAPDLPDPWD